MAKQCCVCGNSIGFMDSYNTLKDSNEYVCERCAGMLSKYTDNMWRTGNEEQLAAIKEKADSFISAKLSLLHPDKLRLLLNEKYNERLTWIQEHGASEEAVPEEILAESEPEPDIYTELCSKMILSTADHLEGYRITKQLGVVFGETVFKPSASHQFSSAVGDMFRELSFSAKEMTGQVSIIEEA